MSANQDMIIMHVADGEGWTLSVSIRHRGGAVTRTYTNSTRASVVHVRSCNSEIVGVSWLNAQNENPSTLLAGDWFDTALEVLTGSRK